MSILLRSLTVNEALPMAISFIEENGYTELSRNGGAKVMPGTFITDYRFPEYRVLFNEGRDANPFFHLFEAMWMLAGRQDLEFVAAFASNMKSFSVDDKTLQAAYGHRWRGHFTLSDDATDGSEFKDQLAYAIRKLVKSPGSRQVVIGIWDPATDMVDSPENSKDRACNLSVVFTPRPQIIDDVLCGYVLDMTVNNRSNDLVWGAYGANCVHFGFLHEFVTAAASMTLGVYTQVGSNTHLYSKDLYGEKLDNALHSPDFSKTGLSNSLFSTMSQTAIERSSAHNLYLSEKNPAVALANWGWNKEAYMVSRTVKAWNVLDQTPGAHTELRSRLAESVLKSIEPLSDLLDHFLKIRKCSEDESTHMLSCLSGDSLVELNPRFANLPVLVKMVVIPMFVAHELWRRGFPSAAKMELLQAERDLKDFAKSEGLELSSLKDKIGGFTGIYENHTGLELDWFVAGSQWINRRVEAKNARLLTEEKWEITRNESGNEWNK